MAGISLNIPIDIPWTVLSASPDMMAQSEYFGRGGYPSPWRTSIAIAAYEPPDEFQELLDCGQRTVLLKITCTLAGYTPTDKEIANGWTYLAADSVTEVWFLGILGAYHACYGALINVSVFPRGGPKGAVARVLDFEPKVRDLYQTATETGEILSASSGEVNTSKSWTKTNSTETGLGHTGKFSYGTQDSGTIEASHYITGKWGNTDQDSSQTTIDAARQRQERFASTTYISQLYNLLTAYHAGTNRAAFLLLPRPHTAQPTNRRTFVQGVRELEGVQEFFLVVTRPAASDGLCIEVTLETGHYPEDVSVALPEIPSAIKTFDLNVRGYAGTAAGGGPRLPFEKNWTAPSGWVIDRTNPNRDSFHEGMKEVKEQSNGQAIRSLWDYEYGAIDDTHVQVKGTIQGQTVGGDPADFNRDYQIFLRPEVLKPSTTDEGHVTTRMLIVARSLATCYAVAKSGCLVVSTDQNGGEGQIPSIVNEFTVGFPVARSAGDSLRIPPAEIIRNTQRALVAAPLMPSRREGGTTPYLASDVFAGQLAPHLSEEVLSQRAATSVDMTVGELLGSSTLDLYRRYDMSPANVAEARLGTLDHIAGRRSEPAGEEHVGTIE